MKAATCLGEYAMSADIRKRVKSKRPSGNIYRSSDIGLWAKYFDCSQQEVHDAVHSSGVMVVDIEDWIERNVARLRRR
jgi:hypothetical protein